MILLSNKTPLRIYFSETNLILKSSLHLLRGLIRLSNTLTNQELEQTIIRTIKDKNPQTVEQLVTMIKQNFQIPEEKILQSIIKLQNAKRIHLKKLSQTPLCLAGYLKTNQTLWFWTTIASVITTAIVVFTIPENFYPYVYIRYVLGTIFVLWLPGYTFIKALFPTEVPIKTSEKSLDTIERIALSFGMSLALVPIIGLLLNYTPWGIRLTPIVLSLLTLTIVFATAAIIREYQVKIKANKENLNVE